MRTLAMAVVVMVCGACGTPQSASGTGGGSGGGGGASGSDTQSVASYQLNGGCRSPLDTGSSVGASCSLGQDCAEVCCPCSTGSKRYSAQVCVNSKCADSSTMCSKAFKSSFCD